MFCWLRGVQRARVRGGVSWRKGIDGWEKGVVREVLVLTFSLAGLELTWLKLLLRDLKLAFVVLFTGGMFSLLNA